MGHGVTEAQSSGKVVYKPICSRTMSQPKAMIFGDASAVNFDAGDEWLRVLAVTTAIFREVIFTLHLNVHFSMVFQVA